MIEPDSDSYERARTTWALAADLRPAAVAFPTDTADAAGIVRRAAAEGWRVAPVGTGHNAHPLGDLSGSVLVRTSGLSAIRVNPSTRRARVGAGAVWAPIVERAGAHGLAALHGSSPDAGVVGYLLGGGLSWYGRSKGLAVNSVTAVELVTADGGLLRAGADHEPDLFWALRGGGAANFGLVTAVEFTLYPIATAYAGMMVWDQREAHRVLSRWAELVEAAPEELTTAYRHMNFPPMPEVPEPFRGRNLVIVDGAALGAAGPRLLAPLRDLAPEIDTFAELAASALVRIHMDPEQPSPGWGRATLLDEFPPAAVDRLIEVAGLDSGTSLVLPAEIRHLGGALSRPDRAGGALSALDGRYQLICGGLMIGDLSKQTAVDTDRVIRAFGSWSRGREYLNFKEEKVDLATAFDQPTLQRLQLIRRQVDPAGLFQANHEL